MAKLERSNKWTFILYLDSVPENYRDIINDYHIQWVESPLHNKDINADGELKKPHIHIMVLFESLKSFGQIKDMFGILNTPIPMKVHSGRSLTRYMAHLDNPDKYQYDESTIIFHGGADKEDLLTKTYSEEFNILTDIESFILTNNVTDFNNLIYHALKYEPNWIETIRRKNTFYINTLIKSNRYTKIIIDYVTGEIIDLKKN